jgi:hypothetical protein
MSDRSLRFVILAPSLSIYSGGRIVLHYLCHLLNESGRSAYLYPAERLPLKVVTGTRRYLSIGRYFAKQLLRHRFRYRTYARWNTPVSFRSPGENTIVVYPEKIPGNPLAAKNVVRWLLFGPGKHPESEVFGERDLRVHFQEAFRQSSLSPELDGGLLRISWLPDDIYFQSEEEPRLGTCYMVRKGAGRPIIHDTTDSLLVDGLPHEELAEVFRRKVYFISYDPYTMYSRLAAMCGCIPVVVPLPGVAKEQWRPEPELRLGIAYGFDDVDWAVQSRALLLRWIADEKRLQQKHVSEFVSRVASHFGFEDNVLS